MRAAGLIIVAIAAVLPSAGSAQLSFSPETGSHIPKAPLVADAALAGQVRKDFAHCIFMVSSQRAVRLLEHSNLIAVDLKAAGIGNIIRAFPMESCLGRQMNQTEAQLGMMVSADRLRDILAEEAYLSVRREPPSRPSAMAALPLYLGAGDDATRAQAMQQFVDCAVLGSLSEADALLRTLPGSGGERTAAAKLGPALGACLKQGDKIALTTATVRSFVAFGLWSRFGRGRG